MLPPHLQSRIQHNLQRFQVMANHAVSVRNVNRRILLCTQSMLYAVQNPCGIYNSKQLEDCLTAIAASHHTPLPSTYKKHHVLHVMSRAYGSGGHTRVVERWLNAAPPTETHHVVVLSQADRPLPASLATRALRLDNGFPLEKALNLRQLAASYDYIVLHTHMHDPVPTLAFGTPEFKRPVVLYNHADHLPWFGCAITDLAVNLRTLTVPINRTQRSIANTTVLPLPIDPPLANLPSKTEAKHNLGISPSSKVIITIASAYKLQPLEGIDYLQTLEDILRQSPQTVALIIGPSPAHPMWQQAMQRSGNRIRVLGVIPYHRLGPYLAAADLALDSFPLSSTTSLLDLARYNIPCLGLDSPINGYDAFYAANALCATTAELTHRAVAILAAPTSATTQHSLYAIVTKESLPTPFRQKLKALSQQVPPHHTIHPVEQGDSSLTPFSTTLALHKLSAPQTLKTRLAQLARHTIYVYVRYLHAIGLTRRLYRKLDSYSLL